MARTLPVGRRRIAITYMKPKFYECGICGHYHPAGWNGDCREDANRFTQSDLDDKYGQNNRRHDGTDNWEEVPMPVLYESYLCKKLNV